jgi:hypothetical protein
MSSLANQENNPMAESKNCQWSTAPDGNQDDTTRRRGPFNMATAIAFNDMPSGILPASGPLRTTPTDHRGGK